MSDIPFNILICGATCCGKTRCMLEMLERDYKGEFEFIIIICPTLLYNTTYHEWKYFHDPDLLAINCEQDDIETILKHVVNVYRGTRTLIILDDVASSTAVKKRTSELVKLAFSARHYNLSTIVITQQFKSVVKPYRENVSKIMCFYNPSRVDMLMLIDNYLNGVGKEELAEISKKLRNKKYSRLEIRLVYPYGHDVYNPGD